jgi:hypothetical protein
VPKMPKLPRPLSQEDINRRTAARRYPGVDPVDPTCRACSGTGTLWRMGRPSSRPHENVTVQENKRAQVRYPGEGKLEGSSVSWDRIAEGCQRPVRCWLCSGTGEITAERLLQLLGRKRPRARNRHAPPNRPSTEELAAIIDGHAAEEACKT